MTHKLFSRFKKIIALLIFNSPLLLTLNYIQTISGIANASPSEILTTYNLVDLLSRFSAVVFMIYVVPKVAILKYSADNLNKMSIRITIALRSILVICLVITTYLTFTDTLKAITDKNNATISNFFAYSLLESTMSIVSATLLLVLGIVGFSLISLMLNRYKKLKMFLIIIIFSLAIVALLICLSSSENTSDYATRYYLIYLNRFQIFTLCLLLTAIFYLGVKYVISEQNIQLLWLIFLVAFGIYTICMFTMSKLNVKLIFFMLNFSGMICAIPAILYVKSKHFKRHFKKISNISPTKKIYYTIVALLAIYIILLLTHNIYYVLLHSSYIRLNQLSYSSYFINTLSSIVTGFVIYVSQYIYKSNETSNSNGLFIR